ncbi:MAG: CRISPR-associated endonuclease Cas2 [Aristaeellaceae bacterium]
MLVVTCDVNVSTPEDARRLRQVAKACEWCGVRAQSSVFEVNVDAAHLAVLKAELGAIMDPEQDSIRADILCP